MKHLIETDRSKGLTIEVVFTPAADGKGLVIDNATDAKISKIHDRFPDAASALSRMSDVARARNRVLAIIVDTPDELTAAPH